jgi:uncharacterized ion transporter superfamily protein YfcC
MKNPTYQFLFKLAIFSLLLSAIAAFLFSTIMQKWYFDAFPSQLILIAVVTGVSHLRLLKSAEKNMRQFTTVFMALVSIKLLIYLSYLLVNLWIDRSNAIAFSLTFFGLYVCYTIFEVNQVLVFLKNNSQNKYRL